MEMFHNNTRVYKLNIAVIGESGVGKTSLITRYCHNIFDQTLKTTTVGSFDNTTLHSCDNKTEIHLKIWDTAGQETYRSMTSFYTKDADIVLLVYDITNEDSFKELNYWINKVKNEIPNDCLITIVGNKSDCIENSTVDPGDAQQFADENQADFLLASAKENTNVKNVFENVAWKKYPELRKEFDNDNEIKVIENDYTKNIENLKKSNANRILLKRTKPKEAGCGC